MSSLTRCNFCSLRRMRERAAATNRSVVLGVDEHGWVTVAYSDDPNRVEVRFLALTDHCVC